MERAPRIVNYGMGVDSTAVLVGLWRRDLRPDLILFADTGGEKPETYEYLAVMNAWLEEREWPTITVVKYRPQLAPYTTLEGNCRANQTLPSIAFRGGGPGAGGCSLKFKAEVMEGFLEGARRGPWKGPAHPLIAEARARGLRPLRYIGYDDSAADRKRTLRAGARPPTKKPTLYDFAYPLQSWGWTRERCIEEIAAAGLPVPLKSACFFCPASKKWEIKWLAAVHPELFLRAVAMEDRAASGKHGLGEKRGLGINFRWRAFAEAEGFLVGDTVVGNRNELLAEALEEKPVFEARDSALVQIARVAA